MNGENTSEASPNVLLDRIKHEISTSGPMPVDRYMELCLLDPDHGAYTARDPIGRDGDFITAPEISQIFGELIGLWCATFWQAIGNPNPFHLIELGPGHGTLMADILRTIAIVPGLSDAISVHLIDASPMLIDRQRKILAKQPVTPVWHQSLDDVPPGPGLVIANEFFDALPIKQLVFSNHGWRERVIDIDPSGHLKFTAATTSCTTVLPQVRRAGAVDGSIAEICPAAQTIVDTLCRRFAQAPGGALIIDYGYQQPGFGDTLQALHRHKYADPLMQPGAVDLTAHVDFSALGSFARNAGAAIFGPMEQGMFLQQLGIEFRAQALSNSATLKQKADIENAVERLTAPEHMGTLFKTFLMTSRRLQPPAPFT